MCLILLITSIMRLCSDLYLIKLQMYKSRNLVLIPIQKPCSGCNDFLSEDYRRQVRRNETVPAVKASGLNRDKKKFNLHRRQYFVIEFKHHRLGPLSVHILLSTVRRLYISPCKKDIEGSVKCAALCT